MTSPKVHEDLVGIVLVGQFNPTIFHPAWLAAKNLIRPTEAEAAQIDVIHPEIAQFTTGPFRVVVTRERFEASTTDAANQAPLRDLVVGTFELLEHTPTLRLGLHRSFHIDLIDVERWHQLGHLLAPKEPWKDVLDDAGLRVLSMVGPPAKPLELRTDVRVEPSQRFPPHSVFILVAAEFAAGPSGSGTTEFLRIIREQWDSTMTTAQQRATRLVNLVLDKGT